MDIDAMEAAAAAMLGPLRERRKNNIDARLDFVYALFSLFVRIQ